MNRAGGRDPEGNYISKKRANQKRDMGEFRISIIMRGDGIRREYKNK